MQSTETLEAAEKLLESHLKNPEKDTTERVVETYEALRRLDEGNHPERLVQCFLRIVQILHLNGLSVLAIPAARNAQRIAEERRLDQNVRRRATMCVGIALTDVNSGEALEALMQARSIAVAERDLFGDASALSNCGVVFAAISDYASAARCYEPMANAQEEWVAATLRETLRVMRGTGKSNLANILVVLGRFEEALRYSTDALDEYGRGRNTALWEPTIVTNAMSIRIRSLCLLNRVADAERQLDELRSLASRTPVVRAQLALRHAEASFEIARGNIGEGIRQLRALKEDSKTVAVYWQAAATHLIAAHRLAGQNELALAELRDVIRAGVARRSEYAKRKLFNETRLGTDDEYSELDFWDQQAVEAEIAEDPSGEHVYRVGALAAMIATRLGWSVEEAAILARAARLHDVGKVGLPHAFFQGLRADPSEQERIALRLHADSGAGLLETCLDAPDVMRMAIHVARHHHERFDGCGYPSGLKGEGIPEVARIAAVADAFDVITHDRSGRPARSLDDGIAEMKRCSGTQFDPAAVDALCRVVEDLRRLSPSIDAVLSVDADASPYIRSRRRLTASLVLEDAERH